jgi:hypothetical protein
MAGYISDIEDVVSENANFRKVLYTGSHMQLVAMSLKPLEDIGMRYTILLISFLDLKAGRERLL